MAVEIDPLTGKPRKQTINFPYPQAGQNLPMVPVAIQQQPIQQQAPQPAAIQQAPAPIQQQAPVQQPQQATGAMTGAGQVFDPNQSKAVISEAQKKALAGASQGTAGLVTQQTQSLLKDPSMGVDYQAQNKQALDLLARKQASDFEAMRQATGGTANLGINVQDLMSAQLGQRQEMTDTQRALETEAQQKKQADMFKALAQGKETVGMEQGLQTSDIQNMITAAGGALGFAELAAKQDILLSEQDFKSTQAALDRELQTVMQGTDINAQKTMLQKKLDFEAQQAKLGYEFTAAQNDLNRLLQQNLANLDAATQKEVINLKGMIDKDQLMTQQDFAKTQAELQRQFEDAMQNKDFAQANVMAKMLNDFDGVKQKKAQEFDMAKQTSQNAFSEKMVMKDQDFNKAMEYLKLETQKALQNNDTANQKVLQKQQSELELQKLTQNFGFQEKLAVLDAELADAKANKDFEKQKQIMSFGTKLEMDKIEKEQGFQESMAYVNAELQKSIADNDFEKTKMLNELQYEQQMKIHNDQMAMDKMKIDLQQQGIDMAKVESEYAKIQQMIASGQVDPAYGFEYLKEVFGTSLPDDYVYSGEESAQNVQKALQQDYLNQQYQYALAQGVDASGNPIGAVYTTGENGEKIFTGLDDSAIKGFNSYLQDTIYGQTGTPLQADIIALKSGDIPFDQIAGVDDPKYKYLLTDVSVPKLDAMESFAKGETGRGGDSRTTFIELEGNKFVNVGGEIWAVTNTNIQDRAGDDWTKYTLTNVATGTVLERTAQE